MDQTAPKTIIDLKNVTKDFGAFQALKGIDAAIQEGEFFSLLGPSGCGKTTLLRLIAGFEEVSSGTILIGGEDMAGISANQRPTNMVFQSYAIFPHLSVAQNVGYGLVTKKMPKAEIATEVEKALAMVDLAGYGKRAAHGIIRRATATCGPGARLGDATQSCAAGRTPFGTGTKNCATRCR